MIESYLQNLVKEAAEKLGLSLSTSQVVIETSKDALHGDYATNIAMQLSRQLRKNPREVATQLIAHLDQSKMAKVEIAGPGFINFFLKAAALTQYIPLIIKQGEAFGNGEKQHKTVNIEFVSANPTGKLHLGHARGASVGDSLARLLTKSGYNVIKEFYVNDLVFKLII